MFISRAYLQKETKKYEVIEEDNLSGRSVVDSFWVSCDALGLCGRGAAAIPRRCLNLLL
uniref:Uncharacterized protein n=1 Tax=Anguilla anguilla TaxID=7936 RepID=A0A0E9P856_ANGAN